MISLQKFFGKTDVFYDLLERSAKEAQSSVHTLKTIMAKPAGSTSMESLRETRRKDKAITQEIDEALCKTFVTDLEREDVEQLANALYKIPKTVEKIAERYEICAGKLDGVDFSKQTAFTEAAVDIVVTMVGELRRKMHLEKIKEHNARLQQIEGDADKHILALLKDLYQGSHDPVRVIMLRDLYDLLEKVVDRCRDAGNVLSHIVLKYT
ncbi:MAG: DUF47 family protein [Verrucomicrobiaceae bacterium]|jgi:uncharacterized protein Yka (UPF0111/DUF47 family)|nr:DUF47 family protein [Verrucomicrobiaceae bacterium]